MNLSALTFFALLLAACSGITLSAHAQSEQSTATELKTLNKTISKLQGSLKRLDRERTSTEKKLQETEQDISTLQRDINDIEKQIKNSQQAITKLKVRKKTLTDKKEHEKRSIATSLRSIYQLHGDDRLKLILNQEDPESFSRQLVYLGYLQEAQFKNLKAFEAIIIELKTNTRQQNAINETLLSKRKRLQEKQQTMNNQRTERQKLVARIQAQYRSDNKKLGNLENQRVELEGILARLHSQNMLSNTPINKMKGKLPWPVKGKLLSQFNQKRADTQIRWQGIRIAAKEGQQAKAVYDGQVVFADWLRGYGQLIILDHGKGYLTLYAHNQSLLKRAGEVVLAGEPLALTGKTGGQSVSGLYFEIRHNGKPQDPTKWLHR